MAVLALTAAACGSSDDSPSSVSAAPPGSDAAVTQPPGTDADTTPAATDTAGTDVVTTDVTAEPAGPTGGNLVVGYVSTVTGLSPHPYGASTFPFRNALYDSLVHMDTSGNPEAALAESWELSPDGTVLTLALRSGVTYHDGTPFDSAAVLANVEWFKDPAVGLQGGATWATTTATAPDASTVVLTFPQPVPEIFSLLDIALISKPGAFDAGIGTGPFVLESFTPRTGLELSANPDYWGDGPLVDSVSLKEFADSSAAELAAQAGDVDILFGITAQQVGTLEGAGLVVLQQPGPGNADILVNSTDAGITDSRVRRALSMAFDRERFVDTILLGYGTPWSSIFPPASPVHGGKDPGYTKFDLDGAKALIDEAGASGLSVDIMSPSVLPADQFMPIYQADLASIGVKLNILPTDPGAWAAAVATPGTIPDLAAHQYGFGDGDPSLLFSAHPFRPGTNASGFVSAEYDSLIATASAETDLAARYAAFKKVDEFVAEEAFVFPIANATGLSVQQSYVAGMSTLRQRIDLTGVTVDK